MSLPNTEFITASSLQDVYQQIVSSRDEYVALDTETNGLRWMANDRAFGIALAWDNRAVFLRNDEFGAKNIGQLIGDIYSGPKTILFHNALFDLHMIRVTYGVESLPLKMIDTLIVAHLLDSSADHRLKGWGEREFGSAASYYEGVVDEYKKRYKIKDYSLLPAVILDPYACQDTVLTRALAYRFVSSCQSQFPKWFEIEHALIPTILDMERRGIKIDLAYITKFRKKLALKKYGLEKELFSLVGKVLNPASPPQVVDYFYTRLRINIEGELQNTSDDVLKKIVSLPDQPTASRVAQIIMDWRESNKIDTTYLEPYEELNIGGRIYPHFNSTGTITSRFSSSGPNVQNLPRNNEFRCIFLPDSEFIDIDYSQLELRLWAHATQEPGMIDAFIQGHDFHAFTASQIYNKDISLIKKNSEERDKSKNFNFLVIYGGGAERGSKTAGITIEESEAFLEAYWKLYPRAKRWVRGIINQGTRDGYVHSLLGHKIPLRERPYAAPNYVVQGCLSLDSWIWTGQGLQPLRNLIDSQFMVWNGNRYVMASGCASGIKRLYDVYLRDGSKIGCSNEHQFLIFDDDANQDWVKAENLSNGQWAITSKELVGGEPMPRDLAELAGRMVGDGDPVCHTPYLMFHPTKELMDLDWYESVANKYGFPSSRIYRRLGNDKMGRQDLPVLMFRSNFREWFVKLGAFWTKSLDRRIPPSVFRWSIDARRAFLRGLISADGGWVGHHIVYTSSKENLARDTQFLLQSCGIQSYLHHYRSTAIFKAWRLRIVDRDEYVTTIGFRQSYKQSHDYSYLQPRSDRLAPPGLLKLVKNLRPIKYLTESESTMITRGSISLSKVRNLLKRADIHSLDNLLQYNYVQITKVIDTNQDTPMGDIITDSSEQRFVSNGLFVHNSAGGVLKVALYRVGPIIKNIGGEIRNTVHDQIVFDNIDHSAIPGIVEQMENFNFSVPITVDVKSSKLNWGSMEEWTAKEKYSGLRNI